MALIWNPGVTTSPFPASRSLTPVASPLRQTTGGGFKLCGNNDAATNNTITSITLGFGIIADNANNVVIKNNSISGVGYQVLQSSGSTSPDADYGHGIYLSGSNSGAVIEGNTIFNNSYVGIHINGDASEGGTGVVTNALIEDNLIYNNGQNGINADGLQSSLIENNLIYGYGGFGVCLYQSDAGGPSIDNVLVNNTIVSTVSGRGGRPHPRWGHGQYDCEQHFTRR